MHTLVWVRGFVALAAATLLASACMTSHDVLTDRPWELVQVDGAAPAAEAGITFGTDGRFGVRPGCNSGGGSYSIKGNDVHTDEVAITAMACGDPADAQEQVFMAVLEADPQFEIETGTGRLRLTASTGTLVFEAP